MSGVVFPEEVITLIGTLSDRLMAEKRVFGTAESCTGGLIAALCTELPGSSRWFAGSIVSYSNSLKRRLLDVDSDTLHIHGAVSREVVEAMACGGLEALEVDVCLSVSGIAGPEGGSALKPVGTIWVGLAARNPEAPVTVRSRVFNFSGDRSTIRMQTVEQGLFFVQESLV